MKRTNRSLKDPAQAELIGITLQRLAHPFRLRAGDVIRLENRLCRVVRVNVCAAVILMNRPARDFKTRFDKPVRFQPKPALVRISPQSDIPILNR